MIARISGKVIEKGLNFLIIDVGGVSYEVFIPAVIMQRMDENASVGATLTLIVYHYLQLEPAKAIPVLVGFLNEVEKEFFEVFITVSGIGPKAALKALNKPISAIVKAIDCQDVAFLKSLPGIGQQRAREIIAKLQNRIGKFGLIQDRRGAKEAPDRTTDIADEALAVLMQLEYKRPEACAMIKRALERCREIQTTEELLNEVYKQRKA